MTRIAIIQGIQTQRAITCAVADACFKGTRSRTRGALHRCAKSVSLLRTQ
jgi:hypothetical protein